MLSIGPFVAVLLFFDISKAVRLNSQSLQPIIINGNYSELYSQSINTSAEYIFLFNKSNDTAPYGARVRVESDAHRKFPLTVVVRQATEILSWQIPLLVQTPNAILEYNTTSRTLCPLRNDPHDTYDLNTTSDFVTISISTASPTNITFKVNVSLALDFYIQPGQERNETISPAQPIYYGYDSARQTENSSVLMRVESNSDTCMIVSIQNISCPVFDTEGNIQFSGIWQTVTRRGGITIPKEAYPLGFFIVLLMKGDSSACGGGLNSNDSKTVTVSVTTSITKRDYIYASSIVVSALVGFCIFYIIGIVAFRVKENRNLREQLLSDRDEPEGLSTVTSPSQIEEVGPNQFASIDEDSSLDEDDIDILEDAHSDKEVIRTKRVLSVCDLARKNPRILKHKSRLYLYYLGTIAVFYTLPVIQLVVTYQQVLHVTGNQDLCYYNFLCAHPLGLLSDFNHVYSNLGYVLLGLLFILLTYTREQKEHDEEKNKSFGIPQHYGLFYAMGAALMMEGVLSGSYHVCPNHSNFQFDTSFMYIMAVLCMVKIYQTRHPDINARAPVTFGVLAFAIFLGLVGVLDGSEYFWIIFTVIHLSACLALTAQIYYMGRWRLDRGVFRRVFGVMRHDARTGIVNLLKPVYPGRLVLLVIVNICNIILAVFGNMHHEKDFDTYLLAVLMANLLLYTFFYIIMKLCHRERILLQPFIYIVLSFVTWAAALHFFLRKSISWALTPAQSRIYNKPCELLNFFDPHDIWHFLSALAMFFSFMVLLTLDDDLVDVHRSLIPVF